MKSKFVNLKNESQALDFIQEYGGQILKDFNEAMQSAAVAVEAWKLYAFAPHSSITKFLMLKTLNAYRKEKWLQDKRAKRRNRNG